MIINTKELTEALNLIQLKGKWRSMSGIKNGQLGDNVSMKSHSNGLLLENGDNMTYVSKVIEMEVPEDLDIVIEIPSLTKYLKHLGDECEFVVNNNVLELSNGNKKANVNILTTHPHEQAIFRFGEKLNNMPYHNEASLEGITFGKNDSPYHACVHLSNESFSSLISACETVGSGQYRMDWLDETSSLKMQSRNNNENWGEEVTDFNCDFKEGATVEFTGPIHKLFDKEEINIYLSDDKPITIISETARLLRAPIIT